MKLVASMMVGDGELDRYLTLTVPALLDFCDEVVVRVEKDLAAVKFLSGLPRLFAYGVEESFFNHEGQARQQLLEYTLLSEPTHILAIDADELVADGAQLRRACEQSQCPVLTLRLEEIWRATPTKLAVRTDGGWHPHNAPVCYQVPDRMDSTWRIRDRKLACGREPEAVRQLVRRGCWEVAETELLHFGWANVGERAARYERYRIADGGRFHAGSHLQSIMWPDERVRVEERLWPEGLPKQALLERVNR